MTPSTAGAVPVEGLRDDWVTLLAGVRISRRWLARAVPGLVRAWQTAPSAGSRRLVAQVILRMAAEAPTGTGRSCRLDDDWVAVLTAWDPRLTAGPDWPPLAAALARARAGGYDLPARLPALLGAADLPARHPARELHWRLLEDCPAAVPSASPSAETVHDLRPPSTDAAASA